MLFLDRGNALVAVLLAEPLQNVAAGALRLGGQIGEGSGPEVEANGRGDTASRASLFADLGRLALNCLRVRGHELWRPRQARQAHVLVAWTADYRARP